MSNDTTNARKTTWKNTMNGRNSSPVWFAAFCCPQMTDWIYRKKVTSIEDMTNLPAKTRKELLALYEIGAQPPLNVQVSIDGTKKYLYTAAEDHYIETAYIPENERSTLCLSSQAGCRMGCLFCMTVKQGFQEIFRLRNLTNGTACPTRQK
jgi:23S rRNA (adenine2503-C2)-methyltransferase